MSNTDGKRILITGGTGSLGTALVQRLLSGKNGNPSSITVFSRGEARQHEMRMKYPSDKLHFVIGDVRDYQAVLGVVANADIVIHTAALKHLKTCEDNPIEAVKTNVGGALNIIQAVKEGNAHPEVVVGVSTDKACLPTNIYGATKFIQERLFISANKNSATRYICVRYGNVIASQGSVIPLFQRQIRNGGTVTVTDPSMTRFLVSLNVAVDTLLAAIETALPGEIYIPQNLPAATVGDIATTLIDYRDITVEIIGIQDREKMHEILITYEEIGRTLERNGYYVVTQERQPQPAIISTEYISKDHVISRGQLRELFKSEGLI